MMTPERFFDDTIMAHEGKLSMHKSDNGNWFDPVRYRKGLPQRRHRGRLVGSKYGVTAYALASYRRVGDITAAQMRDLSEKEAIAIGLSQYYVAPKLNRLPWNRAIMAVVDMAYNAGGSRAVKLLQLAVGAGADGRIGPRTVAAVEAFLEKHGEAKLAVAYCLQRKNFYRRIAKGANRKFLRGWIRRADSFLPGTRWWAQAGV